jgi:hypothetical protein
MRCMGTDSQKNIQNRPLSSTMRAMVFEVAGRRLVCVCRTDLHIKAGGVGTYVWAMKTGNSWFWMTSWAKLRLPI